jgi:predicted CoA-substrate-specific enzyme activase
MIAAGIDVGSRTVKVAILKKGARRPLAGLAVDQGVDQKRIISGAFSQALHISGVSARQLAGVAATGYGRKAVDFADRSVTEITCLARGIHAELPDVGMIIDIGGQDTKVIWIDSAGLVREFLMNDRCAAGTGRFLEMVSIRLGTDLMKLGRLAQGSKLSCPINSTCAVFAESEITGLLATGVDPGRIAAGVHASIAGRVASMAGRRDWERAAFSGGVALVPGVRQALESKLKKEIALPRRPQLSCAVGAALLVLDGGS